MSTALVTWLVIVAVWVLFLSALSAGLMRRFAPALTLREGFFVSLVSYAIATVFFILYFIAKKAFGIPSPLDGIAAFVWLCVAGIIMTKLAAKNYGVQKTGKFGVGAKVMFSLIVISWVFVAIGLLFHFMPSRT